MDSRIIISYNNLKDFNRSRFIYQHSIFKTMKEIWEGDSNANIGLIENKEELKEYCKRIDFRALYRLWHIVQQVKRGEQPSKLDSRADSS